MKTYKLSMDILDLYYFLQNDEFNFTFFFIIIMRVIIITLHKELISSVDIFITRNYSSAHTIYISQYNIFMHI